MPDSIARLKLYLTLRRNGKKLFYLWIISSTAIGPKLRPIFFFPYVKDSN